MIRRNAHKPRSYSFGWAVIGPWTFVAVAGDGRDEWLDSRLLGLNAPDVETADPASLSVPRRWSGWSGVLWGGTEF